MKKIKVNEKELYIVESHNQVLKAWEELPGQNVFTLDYHTDTRQAFNNYSWWRADSEVKKGLYDSRESRSRELADQKLEDYINDRITIDQVNDNLRHDEHLDFAVRTGIVDTAFILSKHSNSASSNPNVHIIGGEEEYRGESLIEYSPECTPCCNLDEHGDPCTGRLADLSIESPFLEEAVLQAEHLNPGFFESYILDIDCDYFNTRRSLSPRQDGVFKKLVRESEFITVALEPECVKICRRPGEEDLVSGRILEELISLIRAA